VEKVTQDPDTEILAQDLREHEVWELAAIVRVDWENINHAARPYLDAMLRLDHVDDWIWQEQGRMICAYFLSNATTWRGHEARLVKAELRRRLAR